ncbi:hypothetical protein ACIP3A_24845 [Streptomyces tricolor]|uniref:hypothetical protein n=1 Tax=Streptomyces TaxID=1883 RepID=UPI001C9C4B61|nr:hypothetical protein [Streptomyces sp. PBH53]
MIDDDSAVAGGSEPAVPASPRTPYSERPVARARRAKAQELIGRLVAEGRVRITDPDDDEVAEWRRVVNYAKRHGLEPAGKRIEKVPYIHIGSGSHRHVLIRRNRTTRELAFYLCWSPTRVALSELVRVAGIRWSVEECFQAAKSHVGRDHYQVRHWMSWHRHIMLAMLALAFLSAIAADSAPARPTDPLHPARSNDPIKLTVPEIRHLLAAVFNAPTMSVARLLHRSTWRRRHQATTRRSHYRRRSADEPTG